MIHCDSFCFLFSWGLKLSPICIHFSVFTTTCSFLFSGRHISSFHPSAYLNPLELHNNAHSFEPGPDTDLNHEAFPCGVSTESPTLRVLYWADTSSIESPDQMMHVSADVQTSVSSFAKGLWKTKYRDYLIWLTY